MPFPSSPYSPVKIDPTNDGMGAAGFQIFHSTPFQNGSNWFFVLYDDSNQLFEVLKSTDDQLTWTVDKTITSVVTLAFRTFSNGTKIFVCYADSGNGGVITFFDYNMTNGTLTGPYGATGSPAITPLGFVVRPSDGKYLVLTTNLPSAVIQPSWYTYNPTGAAWAGPNNLGANATNVSTFTTSKLFGVIDPSASVTHCFYEYDNSLDATRHLCYQQIAANDTLGTFHDFGTGTISGNAVSGNAISGVTDPILDTTNGNILLPIYDATNLGTGKWVLIIGGGFTTPSWAASLIDTFHTLETAPLLQLLGSMFTAVALDGATFSNDRIYYWSAPQSASPGTGWSARSTIFRGDQVSGPWSPGNIKHAVIGMQAAGLFLYFGSLDPTSSFDLEYALGASTAAAIHFRVLTSTNLSPASNNDLDWTLGGVQL